MRRGRTQPKSALDQIKQEIDKQNDEDVQEFSFNKIAIGQFSNEIVQHLLKFTSIISLEFNNCSLKTLQGFVGFKKIIKLCFEENELEGDSLKFIAENFPELQFLSLSHNKIEKIEVISQLKYFFLLFQQDLQPLKQLKQLTQLDLQDNPVSKNANYRSTIFDLCEKLEILDNKDKDGNEVQYSDSEQEEEEDDEDSDENYTQDEEEEDDEEDLSDDDEEDRRRKKRTKK